MGENYVEADMTLSKSSTTLFITVDALIIQFGQVAKRLSL